ncbi:TPA: 4Fe-4S binding protein [Candidatus Avigastranaerophilus faecigallinarum]|nr:4Fe-4S binding protein [Candidatus Avigastranaerophilus faecigallinarum]
MKKVYKTRLIIAIVVLLLAILGIYGVFYSVKFFDIQILPLVQRVIVDFSILALSLLIGIIILTVLFGRIYCSTICPLGIIQELMSILFFGKKRKNKYIKSYPIKYFILAISLGILFGGSATFIRYIEPYSYFGSALTFSIVGIIALLGIIILTFFKNRFFCTNICPAGTILGLISKFSRNKIYIEKDKCISCGNCENKCPAGCIDSKNKKVNNETCIKCLKCIEICPKDSIKYGKELKEQIKFSIQRRKIIISTAVLAVFGSMIKTGIIIKDKIAEKYRDVILPPGAESEERLINTCYNCNLCVENCPTKIISKANNEFPTIHIDYKNGNCEKECNKCSQVCPTGAIKRLSIEEKQKTRIAMAMIKKENCIECGLCKTSCPYGAIIIAEDGTSINAEKCIGCGACKKACNTDAIEIYAVKKQSII